MFPACTCAEKQYWQSLQNLFLGLGSILIPSPLDMTCLGIGIKHVIGISGASESNDDVDDDGYASLRFVCLIIII